MVDADVPDGELERSSRTATVLAKFLGQGGKE